MKTAALVGMLLLGTVQAQTKELKVYISADMEGIGGVSTWTVQADAKGREYEKFRQLMTKEVNAAIEAAYEAGATSVLVSDSHGDAQNLDVEVLDKRAELIRGWPRGLEMMEGVDDSFGAVVFIGYHAAEGTGQAVLAHTMNGRVEIKLNGTLVSEAGFNAAIAGEFGVPVVVISGDQTVTEATRRLLGPIETAVVKHAIGFQAARMIHPEEVQRRIREGVRKGVARCAELKPWKLAHPVQMEIRFTRVVDAEFTSFLPGVQRLSGNTVLFTGRDMIEAARWFAAVEGLNTYREN
jgi:D-amino peptidase